MEVEGTKKEVFVRAIFINPIQGGGAKTPALHILAISPQRKLGSL